MIADALAELVAALEAAGVRVAVRSGDITPPVCYLQLGTVSNAGTPLAGGVMVGFYIYVIPVRGVDNLAGDADLLDSVFAAVGPLACADLTATRTSLTVTNDTWPAYRVDLDALSVAAPLEAR